MDALEMPTVSKNGNSIHVSFGNDSGLFAEFFYELEKQEFASSQEGREIFKEVPMMRILFPGDKTKTIVRRVKMEDDLAGPSDPTRFPKQWALFKASQEQVPDGSALEMWPVLSKARVRELKAQHIHTVEQLASLTDGAGPNIGLDWRQLRDKARAYLDTAAAGAEVSKLSAENEALKTDIEMMKQQIASLAALKEGDETATAKRRGRPPSNLKGE